jgi:hypothetical protein
MNTPNFRGPACALQIGSGWRRYNCNLQRMVPESSPGCPRARHVTPPGRYLNVRQVSNSFYKDSSMDGTADGVAICWIT